MSLGIDLFGACVCVYLQNWVSEMFSCSEQSASSDHDYVRTPTLRSEGLSKPSSYFGESIRIHVFCSTDIKFETNRYLQLHSLFVMIYSLGALGLSVVDMWACHTFGRHFWLNSVRKGHVINKVGNSPLSFY